MFLRRVLLTLVTALAASWGPSLAHAQGCRDAAAAGQAKVVGGQLAKLKNWPGQAALRLNARNSKTSLFLCGGTAIAETWVLTAAHCLEEVSADFTKKFTDRAGRSHTGSLEVVIGVDDLHEVRNEHVYEVNKIYARESYKSAISGRDIALIQLKRSYKGPLMRVSAVPETNPKTPPGAQVRVAGFGAVKKLAPAAMFRRPDGEIYFAGSQALLETSLPTISTAACKARYPSAKIDDEQICAGLEQGGRDSCQGDSGGPLVAYDRSGCPFQIGIVSWGMGCAGARDYGVYTSISHHSSWIISNVGTLRSVTLSELHPAREQFVPRDVAHQARAQLEDILKEAKGRVRISIKGGNRISIGKEVSFLIHSDISGRLIVIDINASNEVTQILPNKFTPASAGALVPAGADVVVPGPDYGFTGFKAVEPLGKGQLIALVVPKSFPAEITISGKEHLAKGFQPVNTPTSYLMNLVQQVFANLSVSRTGDSQPNDWALAVLDYEITK